MQEVKIEIYKAEQYEHTNKKSQTYTLILSRTYWFARLHSHNTQEAGIAYSINNIVFDLEDHHTK